MKDLTIDEAIALQEQTLVRPFSDGDDDSISCENIEMED